MSVDEAWPALPLREWQDTAQTLHMWLQVAGKIRMMLTPPLNHWWHVTLTVTSRGLTTGPIPYADGAFEIQFDFLQHQLHVGTCGGATTVLPLQPQSVALFYNSLMEALRGLGISVTINTKPQEVADPIDFEKDFTHKSYDPEYARRFFRALSSTEKVFQRFRSGYVGKSSPVQFFWGSMDLACARFSGRPAVPPRPGRIAGISHEEVSVGFWPGEGLGAPAFYAYAAPHPGGLEADPIRPAAASWNPQIGEFILLYDDVRSAPDPSEALYAFCTSVYEAEAQRAHWDRAALEEK
ncbi:MAG TPA: DUF5996 family protein [Candidatus Sulfopaludibacter sp.]|jgi:hypothetical protein|nr:DUF5996 family protein [Candidatus Sulfopaludibacter sp.]